MKQPKHEPIPSEFRNVYEQQMPFRYRPEERPIVFLQLWIAETGINGRNNRR